MVIIQFDLLLLITIFHVSHCERRIVGGELVTSERSYVVYLVKGTISDRSYDSWLCGGALVSTEFIITSAACVEDVHYLYAIAGYRKYVNDKNLEEDDCTKQMKKKIVYTCVPIAYEFVFKKTEKWAHIDIALAKVESPYDFDDPRFQLICSYVPRIIPINYEVKRQASHVDAMVLGWGHTEYWRVHGDFKNYNQEYLRFASTTILDKKKCLEEYKDYADLTSVIEKYMICSIDPGHLNDRGMPYTMNQKRVKARCITNEQNIKGLQDALCKDNFTTSDELEQTLMNHRMHDGDETRKHMSLNDKSSNITKMNVNGTGFVKGVDILNVTDIVNGTNIANGTNIVNGTDIANGTDTFNGTDSIGRNGLIYNPGFGNISGYFNGHFTRRNGICQNDHGGPLVTWVGKREVLIGVASVFKISEENECIGPFLYTSTMCNGAFIGCILNDRKANILRGKDASVSTSKALHCDSAPSVRGFDTIESYVSWKDHPDGPADNEKHMRGKLAPNLKKDRYATKVKEGSEEDVNPTNDINTQHKIVRNFRPKKDEQETNDRFSLRIALPSGMRPLPRKRHPLNKRPPLKGSPPKREPSPIDRFPQKMEPKPINSTPPGLAPPPITRPPPELASLKMGPGSIIMPPPQMGSSPIIRLPPEMEPPAFDEILNFKSDE